MSTDGTDRSINSSLSNKTTNSKNTLISLMKEMNINKKLQTELIHCANERKPFPFVPKDINKPTTTPKSFLRPKLLTLPSKPIQRTKIQIEKLGLYEVEKYRPNPSKVRPPEEKERLQNLMAYGHYLNTQETPQSKVACTSEPVDIFNEILLEIKERQDFLQEMQQLGLGKKYLPEIQFQISQRLKELEKLDENRAHRILSEYNF